MKGEIAGPDGEADGGKRAAVVGHDLGLVVEDLLGQNVAIAKAEGKSGAAADDHAETVFDRSRFSARWRLATSTHWLTLPSRTCGTALQ